MRRLVFAVFVLALALAVAAWWWIRPAPRVAEIDAPARRVTRAPSMSDPPRAAPSKAVAEAPAARAPKPATPDPDDPKHTEIRDALAETFRARFPDRDPSDAELDRMASALQRMMAARDALRALDGSTDEGGERRRLRDALGEAVAEFEQVAEHPLSEVTKETGAGGISNDDDPDEAVVFETMEAP